MALVATILNIGGGIYNNGILTITNSTLSGNSASIGGGISNDLALATITNSTLSGNSATTRGGGIDNTGTLTITNSTLSGNSTPLSGGGIYNNNTLTLTNSTLSGNSAINGGGIYNIGTLNYYNTIIANPTSGGDCVNGGAGSILSGFNLVEDGSCLASLSGDPNLGPLQDNGGPTFTHALLSGSIAIDAGNAGVCPSTDQRGVTRPIDGDAVVGAVCDIGAYEYSPDSTFPTVVFDSLVASYASGAGPSNFTVTFSENVHDPTGNTNADDVTNPDNYLVVEDGANGTFNTVSCAGGVAGDDVQATITSVTYNAGLFTATVNLSGALPNGSYRLFVCGTTSIADTVLNTLNNGLSDYTFDFVVGAVTTTPPTTSSVSASALPNTGFAPHKVTFLPAQPAELAYSALGDIWLEIPSQNIKSNIVGIPQSEDKTWNVSWLGNETGWLNGTAFPTWNGNSVLTAHVTDANGLPGPFADLKGLNHGDQIIVHLFDQQYIFEIQNSRMVRPYTTNFAFQSMSRPFLPYTHHLSGIHSIF
ncbi:MAG: sortase [Anaerolineales bacterium]|nr:sortase [Anaerolineales bacterium]